MIIFGRDRATREVVKAPANVAENIEREERIANIEFVNEEMSDVDWNNNIDLKNIQKDWIGFASDTQLSIGIQPSQAIYLLFSR